MLGERLWQANQKVKRILNTRYGGNYNWYSFWKDIDKNQAEKVFGILRKTHKFCSNPFCCGNPRKLGKVTRKEKLANLKLKEGLSEYFEIL